MREFTCCHDESVYSGINDPKGNALKFADVMRLLNQSQNASRPQGEKSDRESVEAVENYPQLD